MLRRGELMTAAAIEVRSVGAAYPALAGSPSPGAE